MACGKIEGALRLVNLEVEAASEWNPEFKVGDKVLEVPMKLHAVNRERLCRGFTALFPTVKDPVIVLKGGEARMRDATDHEELFRQESFFHWAFGVREPDCFAAVFPEQHRAILFVPRLPPEYATWMGAIAPLEDWKQRYEVDEVHYVDEIPSILSKYDEIFYPSGTNTDSGNVHTVPEIPDLVSSRDKSDFEQVFELMSELRMIKTPMEAHVLRYSAAVSSSAHVQVMQSIKPGMMEYQMESLFLHQCYFRGGCRHSSYTCIAGSGENGAILHYGHAGAPNSKLIRDGDMCLFDMGAEYLCYGSDITCSYPANGKFTADQRMIYEAVLAAQKAVFAKLRPNVDWQDMHVLAERTILQKLVNGGLLKGNVDDMVMERLGALFMPHGLGHTLGIDTHDVGGILSGHRKKSTEPGLKSLRMTRRLLENMVVTVEPGVYFNPVLLDAAKQNETLSQYIVWEEVDRFRGFGGVRLEDDVIITKDGYENWTLVPREVADVERVMSGGPWIQP